MYLLRSRINPTDFGADPAGLRDSSQAFELAVSKLLTLGGAYAARSPLSLILAYIQK